MTAEEALKAFSCGHWSVSLNLLNELRPDSEDFELKKELNRALVILKKSSFMEVDQYRLALARVFPEAKMSAEGDCSENDVCAVYNLAVLKFHSGQTRAASDLLRRIPPAAPTHLVVKTQMLQIEIFLLLGQADKALNAVEDLESNAKDTEEWMEVWEKERLAERLPMCRARAFLQLKRCRAFKSNLKGSKSSRESWRWAFLQAHAELLKNGGADPRAIVQVLLKSGSEADWKEVMTNNNLGCVYASKAKPNLAVVYFQNSVASMTEDANGKGLVKLPSPWRAALAYNLGLSRLQAGNCEAAFDCFLLVVQTYFRNPRLWLRLAECCILAQQPSNESCAQVSGRRKEIVSSVIGEGPHRKALLWLKQSTESRADSSGGSGAMPDLSLEFAALCLRNGLSLLPTLDPIDLCIAAKSFEKGERTLEGRFPVFPAPPGPPLSLSEVHRLRCSILSASAYVCLSLNDLQVGLDYAVRLRSLSPLSSVHEMLGRLYAAEALVLLEDFPAAMELLDPTKIRDLSVAELKEHRPNSWFPDSVANAQAIVIYNLSLCFALSGQFGKAAEVLAQIKPESGMQTPVKAIMLGLYLQLQSGRRDAARNLVLDQMPSLRLNY